MATKQIAQGLAGLGRYGDSTLVHMQPEEVAGLQALAKSQGTTLTINPETGLPEAFSLGGFFKSLLPVFVGAATGGAGLPLYAGIAAGAATGALTNKKDPLMGAVMGGMGGYGGFNLGQGFAGAGAGATAPAAGGVQLAGSAAAPTGAGVQLGTTAANQIPAGALDRALAQSGANFDPLAKATAQNIVANTGPGVAFKNTFAQTTLPGDVGYLGQGLSGKELMSSGAIGSASPGGAYSAQQGLQNMGQGFQNVVTGQEGAWDAFKQGLAGAGKAPVSNLSAAGSLAMPLGGAVLSGLEPSDIYGNPIKPGQNPNEKYDPYRSLNLDTETGLRLYAQGGPVSFADGGDAGKDPAGLPGGGLGSLRGGDAGATQGAGMLPLDVSDINAKYGVEDAGVPVPRLGLFADNNQIEAARTSYETQLKAAMSGRGGMGSPYGFGGMGTMNRGGTDIFGRPTQVRGMGGMQNPNGGMNSMGMMTRTMGGSGVGSTAPTASTAETALARLNLNKNYANGGSIQAGGTQDLYGSQDDAMTGPMLSRNGYGLGRLQAMADGGATGYAKGGETRYTVDKNTLGGKMFGETGVIDQLPPSALAELLNNPGMRHFMGLRAVEEPKYYTASGAGMGGGDALNLGRSTGVNLNTASGLGMAKGGYLDGPGDGMSDSIPATIEGKQPARLADGEFVIPADVVSHLGNGSTKAGSQRLYGMLDKVRKARTGTKKQGKQIKPEKYMPA